MKGYLQFCAALALFFLLDAGYLWFMVDTAQESDFISGIAFIIFVVLFSITTISGSVLLYNFKDILESKEE